MNIKRGSCGVITVLVSLMLTGILSLGTLSIEIGRFQAAKTQLSEANISAGTSMIAAYDSILYDRYGLLSIDSEAATLARYRDYLEFNSDRSAGYEGNNISTFYTVDTVEMEEFYNLTYPSVLKRQVLSCAKYNVVPQDYSFNYYNMDHTISDIQSKAQFVSDSLKSVANGSAAPGSSANVSGEITSALKNMYSTLSPLKKYDDSYNVTLNGRTVSLLPSKTGTVSDSIPAEDILAINKTVNDAKTVLGADGSLLSSSGASYAETDATVNISFITSVLGKLSSTNSLYSNARSVVKECRNMIQGINAAMNVLKGDKDGNLLLNSYIAEYFPNKNYTVDGYTGCEKGTAVSGVNDASFSGACVEYAFAGNASEIANQESAYNYVMAMRLVSNLYSTIQNSSSFNQNNACSVVAHVAWAYYETWIDAELLFRYNAVVPYGKYNSILNINNPSAVKNAFASRDFLGAMRSLNVLRDDKFVIEGVDETDYRDALAMALWLVPNSKKLLRIADLVQIEMRYKERYVDNKTATFLMSEQNTFCRVKCTAKLNSILPVISFSSGGVKGTQIQSIKYIGY